MHRLSPAAEEFTRFGDLFNAAGLPTAGKCFY
jgi:hypothetical protein